MLDRAFLKSFFTWLEEATLAELEARREQLRSAMPVFTSLKRAAMRASWPSTSSAKSWTDTLPGQASSNE